MLETFLGTRSQPDFSGRQKQVFAKVREAIDAEMPVIGSEMKTPEVYLVTGYDCDGHYLFADFEEGKTGRMYHRELGFLWFQFPELGHPADDGTTVREALRAALDLAEGEGFNSSNCGLRSYDNWIEGLADTQGKERGFGAAYDAACWSDCRRWAAPFVLEAKGRLDDPELVLALDLAIEQYGIASKRLDDVARLFPFAFGADREMVERFKDEARRREAQGALVEAKAAESAGLEALKDILRAA